MNEIEVGEYIRTTQGYIGKLLNYDENDIYFGDIECNFIIGGMPIEKENIKAHSKNIIDLIEVGDYVNGNRVQEIIGNMFLEVSSSDIGSNRIFAYMIKTILTHEQYEQNCYKVGDIE